MSEVLPAGIEVESKVGLPLTKRVSTAGPVNSLGLIRTRIFWIVPSRGERYSQVAPSERQPSWPGKPGVGPDKPAECNMMLPWPGVAEVPGQVSAVSVCLHEVLASTILTLPLLFETQA